MWNVEEKITVSENKKEVHDKASKDLEPMFNPPRMHHERVKQLRKEVEKVHDADARWFLYEDVSVLKQCTDDEGHL